MGRVLTEKRTIVGTSAWTKSAGYTYNRDGSIATISNPGVGRVMTYTPTGAGRMKSVVNTGGSINFVTNATYAPPGELASYTNGASITVTNSYNNRFQPVTLAASTTAATIMSLNYNFSFGSGDNGTVRQIVNNRDNNRTQNFLYDSLNRIQQAYTTGPNWGETFSPTATSPGVAPTTPGIDAWGNLTNRSGVTGKNTYEALNCPANTKNQLTTCSINYDAAGNTTTNGSATYVYDAENRLKTTAGWTYVYDGDGHRVKKVNGSSGTLYWPDLNSNTLNESSLGATNLAEYVYFEGERVARIDVPTPLTVKYYFSDHLGSASVITDANGTMPPLKESDYYPYGGEIPITTGDSNHYKFTGKERDAESGLDNFGARYDASSLGRFMTPDWAVRPTAVPYASFGNPQTLNLYAYVANDPISRADGDGHGCSPPGSCFPWYFTRKNAGSSGPITLEAQQAAGSQAPSPVEIQQVAQNTYNQGAVSDDQVFLQQEQAGEKQAAQQAIDRGEPPNGEYSFVLGKSCPDCKYYPKEVVEAVNAHESQHAKDEHTLSGFFKLFTKNGRRDLETRAFKAELGVEQRNIKNLESVGQRTPMQEKTLIILRNMRDQAEGAIAFPQVYTP